MNPRIRNLHKLADAAAHRRELRWLALLLSGKYDPFILFRGDPLFYTITRIGKVKQ